MLDPEERKETIREQVQQIMRQESAVEIKWMKPCWMKSPNWSKLPPPCCGTFDQNHLQSATRSVDLGDEETPALLPGAEQPMATCCLISLPCAMAMNKGLDVVTDGNEQVIRARFADADFLHQ